MERTDVTRRLLQYLDDELLGADRDGPVGEDDNLLGGGLIDSLGMMRLVAFIEESFDLKVPPEDVTIENFLTVGAIGTYVEGRKASA